MSDLERRMERFLVAARVLVDAYGEVTQQGRFLKPGLAAAAFSDMERLLGYLKNAELDGVAYTGADVNELILLEKKFHLHTCSCPFCFGDTTDR